MVKKVLLSILGVLVLLVAAVLVIASTKPDSYRVERRTTIAAPAAAVFAHINDFHRWQAWSPWEDLDPNMKKTYAGPEQGVGASYAWTGNDDVGEGKMTIIDSRPSERVDIRLEFIKPFTSTNTTTYTLTPSAAGTEVRWAMEGPSNFPTKIMTVFADMDSMIGKDFEKGLSALKRVAEAGGPSAAR